MRLFNANNAKTLPLVVWSPGEFWADVGITCPCARHGWDHAVKVYDGHSAPPPANSPIDQPEESSATAVTGWAAPDASRIDTRAQTMASYADHGHDHAHEDEDDESGSLLEPVAVLRLLLQFLSAGSDSGDLEVRERAGTFIWDLSAEAEHCALLARHLGAFVELLSSARTPPRFRELAVGTLANVAAHEACVLSSESIRDVVAASYAEAADPGLLTEAARLLHVAVTRLASSRYRAAGDGGTPGPPTAASNLGDAWADTVASLSGKTLFVLRNSLDAPLLARVFELCSARR